MSSQFRLISDTYEELSGLYKNPTRNPNAPQASGFAAANVHDDLTKKHTVLAELFQQYQELLSKDSEMLYFKVLALLYELDLYFGVESPRRTIIVGHCEKLIRSFANRPNREGNRPFDRVDFAAPRTRSELKAKIRCCVAAIESRRRTEDLDDLAGDLRILERFISENLHRPPILPAWTTLALVLSAQARLARQAQNYEECQQKLLEELGCLNERSAEIVDHLFESKDDTKLMERQIEELKDDLIFIRRKQTLSSFFNVGLTAFQRGFLKTANQACQAARLQFRLHGQFFHEVFNDLIILSIKRARTSRGQDKEFQNLKNKLVSDILPRLKPTDGIENPKLYLYGLRELAVLQYYCEETDEMLKTLKLMDELIERHGPERNQWKCRVSILRARALWRNWVRQQDTSAPDEALKHAQEAFTAASNLSENISAFPNTTALCSAIERSKKSSRIDTIESLVTYGSIQASAKQFVEAVKSASAVIQLSGEDNPRLCAMGYLVRAEALAENGQIVQAQREVVHACELEARIDHCYVADRRKLVARAIERQLPQPSLFLGDMKKGDFKKKGQNRLLGWFIETKTDKKSKAEVEEKVGVSRGRLNSYLRYLSKNESDPYHYLVAALNKREDDRQ